LFDAITSKAEENVMSFRPVDLIMVFLTVVMLWIAWQTLQATRTETDPLVPQSCETVELGTRN
jgi:hypothetical protein